MKHALDLDEPYTFPDGTVIRKSEILYSLNTSALEIFNLFDGSRSVSDVIDEIESRYSDDDVRKDTGDFISQLYDTGLLVK
ncbi:PqqD family protein [Candidatus Omnitrophota bacterium]